MRLLSIVFLSCLCACANGAPKTSAPATGLVSSLTTFAEGGQGKDRFTALYLLAKIDIDADNLNRLQLTCGQPISRIDALFCAYLMYNKLQSLPAARQFIDAFPANVQDLRSVFANSLRVELPVELIDLLRNLATTDDAALQKLVVASDAADGWIAESLASALGDLKARNPERIRKLRQ